MRFTNAYFLEQACRWAYERSTRHIDDNKFLPHIKKEGISDSDIERFKNELERSGQIMNHRGIGGMRDFELSRSIFRQYLQRVLPAPTLAKAQDLYRSWNRSLKGPFSTATFVEQLGVTEIEATYYLEVLRGQ